MPPTVAEPGPLIPRLPVFRTVATIWRDTARAAADGLRAAAGLLIVAAFALGSDIAANRAGLADVTVLEAASAYGAPLSVLIGALIAAVAITGLHTAVAWHRRLIDHAPVQRLLPVLDRPMLRYGAGLGALAFAVALTLAPVVGLAVALPVDAAALVLAGPPAGLHAAAVATGASLAILVGGLAARAALILPARAVGDELELIDALRRTRGNTLRLLAVWVISLLPLVLVALAVERVPAVGALEIVRAGLRVVADVATFIVALGVLSIVYRHFSELPAATGLRDPAG